MTDPAAPERPHDVAPDAVPDASPTATVDLLRGRFGWFFVGRTVDWAGSSMTTVALALAVLHVSGRASDLGVVLAANVVPALALLLVGGAVADRASRRTVLIASHLGAAGAMAAASGVLISGHYDLVVMAVLSMVNGAVSAFAQPALRGIVPELVARRDLQRANALLSSSQSAVRVLAPVAAGTLVATVGGGWALAVDAASSVVAAIAFVRVPPGARPPATGRPLWRDMADGWATFRSLRWVVVMAASFAVVNALVVGPWNVLGPQVVAARDGDLGWGAVQGARALGLLVMALVAVRITLRRPLRDGRLWGVLAALPLLAVGLSGSAWVVAVAAFVGGLGFTLSSVTWESTLQAAVPAASLSRVSAYDDLLSFLAIPLSQVAVGPLAERFGAQTVCAVCGAALVAASLVPLLDREVRTLTT